MQFKLTDLMWFTAYFAAGAWLFSSGFMALSVIWAAAVFGFEIGTRADYSTFLLTVCGMVLGLAICVAWMGTNTFSHKKLLMFGKLEIYSALLAIVAWSVAGAIFYWLVTRVKKSRPLSEGKETDANAVR